jgi:hypothetical protein
MTINIKNFSNGTEVRIPGKSIAVVDAEDPMLQAVIQFKRVIKAIDETEAKRFDNDPHFIRRNPESMYFLLITTIRLTPEAFDSLGIAMNEYRTERLTGETGI